MSTTNTETSTSLLQRLGQHEPQAWEDFATKYVWVMRSALRTLRIHPADIDDVLQDSCLRVFQNIHRYQHRGQGSFRAWLKAIARSCWLQAVRKSAYRARSECKVVDLTSNLSEEALGSIDMQIDLLIEQELLDFAIARTRSSFNELTWRTYQLAAIEQLSGKEVANLLGISVDSVYKNKERFETKLQEELQGLNNLD